MALNRLIYTLSFGLSNKTKLFVAVDLPKNSEKKQKMMGKVMMKAMLSLLLFSHLLTVPAYADNAFLKAMTNPADLVGEGRFSVFVWDVYDAKLFAPNKQWRASQPFALSLTYLRNLSGNEIAKRSAEEMRKIGCEDKAKLQVWYQQMMDLFPDVAQNVTLTGIQDLQGVTHFYQGNQKLGEIADPEFGQWFFGIWLNQRTSEPEFRRKLLGLG